ncbi:MAG: hypothetical protein GY953_32720 [bacterium]|nr:hypothetical protein [bacterium]
MAQTPATDSRNVDPPHTDTHFTASNYPTRQAWETQKKRLKKQILFAAGLHPMPEKTPLHPKIFGRITRDGYTIEKVYIETLPGYYLAGNLYRPTSVEGRFPGVLKPHGHWSYGRLEHQPLNSTLTLGANLARQGYVVFAYDMVGYTDTVQTPHRFDGKSEQLWLFHPLGLQLWNSIRALDFLENLPDVDAERLAITGASGGGTQTFLLAAVDDRIQVSAPVNMVSAIMQGGCICENAPGLRVDTFNVEFAAMMAPRPMLLVSATGDWTKNVPTEEYPAIRDIYRLYSATDKLEFVQIDAPHNYNQSSREAVYRFFARHVLGESGNQPIAETKPASETLPDLLVFHARNLPGNALTYDQLFEQWKQMARHQMEQAGDTAALTERLRLALHAEWPEKVTRQTDGERVILSRPEVGDHIPAIYRPGAGQPVLIVHSGGIEDAQGSQQAKDAMASPRPVLLVDAYQTGSAVAPRDTSLKHFFAFNLTVDANRVQDILTALAFLSQRHQGKPELIGLAGANVWSLFAAAIAPIEVTLTTELSGFAGIDEEFVNRFFVPGIQRVGGLAAANKILGRRQ